MTIKTKTPSWIRDAVFYQIFPDRFYNGLRSNDPENVQKWGDEPNGSDWMGGDLNGLARRLDYLEELGVNAIYLNPIFNAGSNHGYDTIDYKSVSPIFGTNEQFRKLVTKIHDRGWHILLDGVFEHTSTEFWAFKSILEEGEKSPYRDWYKVKKLPLSTEEGQDTYIGWKGVNALPMLNIDNPDTRKYLLDVAVYWIKEFGIDGWRLDDVPQIEHSFWKEFRKAIKKANPETYIVGEIRPDACDWLQGDEMDAVTNYQWRGAVYNFAVDNGMTPTDFDRELASIRERCHVEFRDTMFNMLSSHDAERLKTRCNEDPLRIGQCVLLQMTCPGVPCVYYGDEIGMTGEGDPEVRGAFNWDRKSWDKGLFAFYQRLIRLRRESPALRNGEIKTVLIHDDNRLYGYMREHSEEKIIALYNVGDSPQCASLSLEMIGDESYTDLLNTGIEMERNGDEVTISMPAHGIALLGSKERP